MTVLVVTQAKMMIYGTPGHQLTGKWLWEERLAYSIIWHMSYSSSLVKLILVIKHICIMPSYIPNNESSLNNFSWIINNIQSINCMKCKKISVSSEVTLGYEVGMSVQGQSLSPVSNCGHRQLRLWQLRRLWKPNTEKNSINKLLARGEKLGWIMFPQHVDVSGRG